MKLTDKAHSVYTKVLVFGPPKSGKTQMVGTLASKFKLLWFDLEHGYETLMKLPEEQQANIELIAIPDSREYPIAVETMLKVIKGKPVDVCDIHGKVSCMICKKDPTATIVSINLNELPADTILVIDSLTQYTNSAIANITKAQPDDYKLEFDDWGNLKVLVEKFLSQIQALPCKIACISHEEEVKLEGGKTKIVPVCGSSKSSRNTAKYFDHVIYCEVKNKKHIAASSTTYMNNILTGSRSDIVLEDGVSSLLDIFSALPATVSKPGASMITQGNAAESNSQRTSAILNNLKGKRK